MQSAWEIKALQQKAEQESADAAKQKKEMIAGAAFGRAVLPSAKIIGAERLSDMTIRVDLRDDKDTVWAMVLTWELEINAKPEAKGSVPAVGYMKHKKLLADMLAEFESQLGHAVHPTTLKSLQADPDQGVKSLAEAIESFDPPKFPYPETQHITVEPLSQTNLFKDNYFSSPPDQGTWTCVICNGIYDTKAARKMHVAKMHGVTWSKMNGAGCLAPGCDFNSNDIGLVQKHAQNQHGMYYVLAAHEWVMPPQTGLVPKGFEVSYSVTGLTMLHCLTCHTDPTAPDYNTSSLDLAKEHYDTNHKVPDSFEPMSGGPSYICKKCGWASAVLQQLDDHVGYHAESDAKNKPQILPPTFYKMNGVGGEPKWKCATCANNGGISYITGNVSSAWKHHDNHKGNVSFNWQPEPLDPQVVYAQDGTGCHVCGHVSVDMSAMVAHAQAHLTEPPVSNANAVKCMVGKDCEFMAATVGELNQHIETKHFPWQPSPTFQLKQTKSGTIDYSAPATVAMSSNGPKPPLDDGFNAAAKEVTINKGIGVHFCEACQKHLIGLDAHGQKHVAAGATVSYVPTAKSFHTGAKAIIATEPPAVGYHGIMICQLCKDTFATEKAAQNHMYDKHHGMGMAYSELQSGGLGYVEMLDDKHKYKCLMPGCNQSWNTLSFMNKHIKNNHGGPKGPVDIHDYQKQIDQYLAKLNSLSEGWKFEFEFEPTKGASRIVRVSKSNPAYRSVHCWITKDGSAMGGSWAMPGISVKYQLHDQNSFNNMMADASVSGL